MDDLKAALENYAEIGITFFGEKYQELVDEGVGFEEDIDEFASERIFFVTVGARWSEITTQAGTVCLDEASLLPCQSHVS